MLRTNGLIAISNLEAAATSSGLVDSDRGPYNHGGRENIHRGINDRDTTILEFSRTTGIKEQCPNYRAGLSLIEFALDRCCSPRPVVLNMYGMAYRLSGS